MQRKRPGKAAGRKDGCRNAEEKTGVKMQTIKKGSRKKRRATCLRNDTRKPRLPF
jgi:hypothetical protein